MLHKPLEIRRTRKPWFSSKKLLLVYMVLLNLFYIEVHAQTCIGGAGEVRQRFSRDDTTPLDTLITGIDIAGSGMMAAAGTQRETFTTTVYNSATTTYSTSTTYKYYGMVSYSNLFCRELWQRLFHYQTSSSSGIVRLDNSGTLIMYSSMQTDLPSRRFITIIDRNGIERGGVTLMETTYITFTQENVHFDPLSTNNEPMILVAGSGTDTSTGVSVSAGIIHKIDIVNQKLVWSHVIPSQTIQQFRVNQIDAMGYVMIYDSSIPLYKLHLNFDINTGNLGNYNDLTNVPIQSFGYWNKDLRINYNGNIADKQLALITLDSANYKHYLQFKGGSSVSLTRPSTHSVLSQMLEAPSPSQLKWLLVMGWTDTVPTIRVIYRYFCQVDFTSSDFKTSITVSSNKCQQYIIPSGMTDFIFGTPMLFSSQITVLQGSGHVWNFMQSTQQAGYVLNLQQSLDTTNQIFLTHTYEGTSPWVHNVITFSQLPSINNKNLNSFNMTVAYEATISLFFEQYCSWDNEDRTYEHFTYRYNSAEQRQQVDLRPLMQDLEDQNIYECPQSQHGWVILKCIDEDCSAYEPRKPSYVNIINGYQLTFGLNGGIEQSEIGTHTFKFGPKGPSGDYKESYLYNFTGEILEPLPSESKSYSFTLNLAPSFIQPIDPIQIRAGEVIEELYLGTAQDFEGDNILVSLITEAFRTSVKIWIEKNDVFLDLAPKADFELGIYNATVNLKDDNPESSMISLTQFTIEVLEPIIEEDFSQRKIVLETPVAEISEIDQFGVLKLNFSLPIIQYNPDEIKRVEKLQCDQSQPEISIEIILQESEYDQDPLLQDGFNWDYEIQEVTSQTIVIQIEFEKPEIISRWDDPDQIEIKVCNFYSLDGAPNDPSKVIDFRMPNQLNAGQASLVAGLAQSSTSSLQMSIVTNTITQVFIGGSLTSIFELLGALQIIVFIVVFNIDYPWNYKALIESLGTVADLKIMSDELFEQIAFPLLPVEKNQAPGENFQIAGFQSFKLIENLQFNFHIMVFTAPLLVLLMLLIGYFQKFCCQRKSEKWIDDIYELLFFAIPFRFVLQNLIDLMVSTWFNLKHIAYWPLGELLSTMCSISMIPTLSIFFIYTVHISFSSRQREFMQVNRPYRKRNQSVFSGLKPFDKYAAMHPSLYVLRRMHIIGCAFILDDKPLFQVANVIYLQLFKMSFSIRVKPFIDQKQNWTEMINELTIWMTTIFLCGFLASRSGIDDAYGWLLIALICSAMALNIMFMMSGTYFLCRYKYRLMRAKRMRDKQIVHLKKRFQKSRKAFFDPYQRAMDNIDRRQEINNLKQHNDPYNNINVNRLIDLQPVQEVEEESKQSQSPHIETPQEINYINDPYADADKDFIQNPKAHVGHVKNHLSNAIAQGTSEIDDMLKSQKLTSGRPKSFGIPNERVDSLVEIQQNDLDETDKYLNINL